MAGADILLDAADPVGEAGRAGLHPDAGELFVAGVRVEALAFRWRVFVEADAKRLILRHVRHLPRLRRIGDIAVGEEHDGRHILDRDAAGLDRAVEGVGGRASGDDRHRGVAVAAVDRLVEVRLLGLGRKAGRRSAALRVDDNKRQLGHDRQAERLGLESDTGARR